MEVGFDVWYKNPGYKNLKDELWLSGVVLSKTSDEEGNEVYVVRNAKNVDVSVKFSKDAPSIYLKNPFPVDFEDNLSHLPYLNEPDILQAIQSRYKNDQVCTLVGPVLVSMNVYKESPDLSNLSLNSTASVRIRDLASSAFKQIRESFATGEAAGASNQHARHHSILISGDSGSGKSECSKLLLKCLIDENAVGNLAAAADAEAKATTSSESAAARPTLSKRAVSRTVSKKFSFVSGLSGIIDKIALASVVLEAFGNAKTLVNDNSTRFGLYTQVQYTNSGLLIGGQLHTYLLEWNRLHTQQLGERNFHIFYQLVAGASEQEKTKWNVGSLKDYQILNQGRASIVSHIDDAGDFLTLKEHLEDLEFDQELVGKMFEAVVAVLLLGQVQFKSTFDNNGEGCAIVDMEHFGKIAALVGLPVKDFESLLVLRNSLVIRGESFERKMTTTHAVNARHAVSVAIYKRLFKWLVNTLNSKIAPSTTDTVEASVSIVDIFGFRNHEQNYFEDLCMNYANEILQQHVNQQVFKREIAYFKQEGITFDSNSKVFDVASKQIVELIGTEIFGVLDEQCSLPDCTDNKVAKQLYSKCENRPGFVLSELNRTDKSFVIRHFSTLVTYSMKGFIEKNTDELPIKFNQVFDTATNSVLGLGNQGPSSPKKAAAPRRASHYQASQVMHTFKDQLSSLIERIQTTDSQFIRCIKPTDTVYHRVGAKKRVTLNAQGATERETRTFHAMTVSEQLRNSGVYDAARASRSEFTVRVKHIDFYNRYRLLVIKANASLASELPNLHYDDAVIDDTAVATYCRRIVELLKTNDRIVKYLAGLKPKVPYLKIQVGSTKVFLAHSDHLALESALNSVMLRAKTVVHNFCACIIKRNWFKKAIKAIAVLQRNCKMGVHRRRFVSYKNAITSLQRTFRRKKILAIFFGSYEMFKHYIIRIQSMYRMHRCQLKLRRRQRILKIIKLHEEDLRNAVVLRDHRKEKEAADYQEWKAEQISGTVSNDERTALIRSKNVDTHLAAFRSLDEDLRMRLEAMIKSLKPIEVISKVLFDIGSSKKLLGRWANSMPEGQLKMMTNRVCAQLEYGHKVLKAHKLLPKTILKKMFSASEDRTNLPVDSQHPLFENVTNLITDLKYLVAVTDSTRKNHTNSLNELKRSGAKDPASVQKATQLQQAILSVSNINKFCLILQNYYVEYIPFVVREYGSNSAFRKKFNDNKSYLHALHALITQGRPLNEEQELFLKSKHKKQNDNQNVSVNNDFALKVREDDTSRILQYQGLYFKYMPYAPGIEFSVNCVRSMFMTEPQVPTRVMRIKGMVHQHPKVAYYQAAVAYSDLSLQDILSTPRGIELLDYESLSATLLTTILMGCSIVHPENVMVQPSKDATGNLFSVKVLGITNTYNFTEGVFDYATLSNASTTENFKKFGYNKYQSGCTNNNLNALFFLPQMDEPVDPVVRAIFTKNGFAPEQIVSEWLKFMYLRNKGYEALAKVGFTEHDFSSLKLPIYLPKRVGISMYRRLRVVNSLFHPVQPRRHAADTVVPNVTHQMILSAFCPYVGKFYATQRKSFEFPEYPNLIPFNVMYSETLAERVIAKQHAKRRTTLQAKEDKQNANQFVSAAISKAPAHENEGANLTMAQRLIKERESKRPSVTYNEESAKAAVITAPVTPATPATPERPALTSAMSVKFAQIYGTPHTKASLRDQYKESHNDKANNQSYISLDFGGIYGEEEDFSGGANDDEEGGSDKLYTDENAQGGPTSPTDGDFDFDNIYTELDFAYDHQSTTQGKKVSQGEVIEYQSPPKREMPAERVVSFMVDVNDIYGGKDEEFDYSAYKKEDSDEEPADEEEDEEEQEEGDEGEEKENANNQSMYSTMSDSEANAAKYGEKFSFGPTVLTHDSDETEPMFNTSIADVAAEFLSNVDFERLSIENNHEVVGRMVDNLFFVTKMTLYKVSEAQLNVMFGKYVKQGVIGPLVKRQSAKYITGNSGVITSQTPLKGDLLEPLLTKEIVIVHKDAEKMESIKDCDLIDQLESVLDIKVTFVLI